jgi:hypothetical protein
MKHMKLTALRLTRCEVEDLTLIVALLMIASFSFVV